jgi:hypothetical protein
MADSNFEIREVELEGDWLGNEVRGRGAAHFGEEAIVLETAAGALRVSYNALWGVEWRAGRLTIHATDVVISLHGASALERAFAYVLERACELPELTTGLRSLGSRRGGSMLLQERFFAPLLQARRRLEEQRDIAWRLAAFDAAELRTRLETTLESFARERHPEHAPARRALEARLLDEAAPLLRALSQLEDAARDLRQVEDAAQFSAWREWTRLARLVFEQADRSWQLSLPLLGISAPAAKPRRRLGRGGRMLFLVASAGMWPAILRP